MASEEMAKMTTLGEVLTRMQHLESWYADLSYLNQLYLRSNQEKNEYIRQLEQQVKRLRLQTPHRQLKLHICNCQNTSHG